MNQRIALNWQGGSLIAAQNELVYFACETLAVAPEAGQFTVYLVQRVTRHHECACHSLQRLDGIPPLGQGLGESSGRPEQTWRYGLGKLFFGAARDRLHLCGCQRDHTAAL